MHTVVEQPLTATSHTGRISCRPLGQEPIEFEWISPDGSELQLEQHGSEASGLPPGRYRIEATDASGARADVSVDVDAMFAAASVIESYRVTPASTGFSRDGLVEAVGTGLDGLRFLWTNGTETDGPVLKDVPCGTYVATPLPQRDRVPVVVHTCAPAKVDVSPHGWPM